ncbi:MAG: hypothetical protein SNF33_03585 [Candidatus Algichlamydia australiensis]|nr:hypothetical protein [Chlamydiales bacterium]
MATENQEKMHMDLLSGGGWIYWLMERGKQLLFLLPLLGIGLYFMVKSTHAKTGKEADFLAASITIDEWEKSGEKEKLERLQALMGKHPELKARFEDRIAYRLISLGDYEGAMPFAKESIARSDDLAPEWADFGRTTLLIGNQEYEKALAETIRLKGLLDEKASSNFALLQGFTLLRLAALYHELGNSSDELAIWNEFEHAANGQGSLSKETFEILKNHFTDRNVDLLDYIRYRKGVIKQ